VSVTKQMVRPQQCQLPTDNPKVYITLSLITLPNPLPTCSLTRQQDQAQLFSRNWKLLYNYTKESCSYSSPHNYSAFVEGARHLNISPFALPQQVLRSAGCDGLHPTHCANSRWQWQEIRG